MVCGAQDKTQLRFRPRKNALCYKTEYGAHVVDLFMRLIHTGQLCGSLPSQYLTKLQRHGEDVAHGPQQWLPWNYEETLLHVARSIFICTHTGSPEERRFTYRLKVSINSTCRFAVKCSNY